MDEDRIRWLNARLPTKRAIGHGLIRSREGHVLLCQLTYKQAWDLPGGVIEPGESPHRGCLREVFEELGVALRPEGLLAVNWMSPWRGWDDACTFLFDLGTHPRDLVDGMVLERREIAAVHWCAPEQVASVAAPATARLLGRVLRGAERTGQPAAGSGAGPAPLYLEDAADPW